MEERIRNTIKLFYDMGYIVMGKANPMTQYALTNSVINAFKNGTPRPIEINYIFTNINEEKYIWVTVNNKGYFTMRDPTTEELKDYWSQWEE